MRRLLVGNNGGHLGGLKSSLVNSDESPKVEGMRYTRNEVERMWLLDGNESTPVWCLFTDFSNVRNYSSRRMLEGIWIPQLNLRLTKKEKL